MDKLTAPYIKETALEELTNAAFTDMTPLLECIKGDKPKQETLFKALNSERYLYFVFRAYDDYINPVRTEYNSKIYLEEVVEVFITGENLSKYIEIEVSPINTKFQALIRKRGKKRGLKLIKEPIFESIALINDSGYDIIIKLDKKKVADKLNIRRLDKIRFNAYRIDRPVNDIELSALNPTYRDTFHVLSSFIGLIEEEL